MHTRTITSPLRFFVLVFLLSIPFWLIGGNRLPVPMNLPTSSLMFITPLIAAVVLTYREHGSDGVKNLLKRTADARRSTNKLWYVPIFCLLPLIYGLAYAAMSIVGAPLPDQPHFPIVMAPVLFVVFFFTAVGEELGWSGYAIERLRERWNALAASIIVGSVWALLHIVPDLQADHTLTWIVWQRLYTVVLRILIVWLYSNTGKSVFAAIVFHATDNVSFSLFPNDGSHYDPFFTWLISAVTAAIVICLWGAATLARYRYARRNPPERY
jgi:membrane protease YdiL (CAAX protease family)